METAALAAAFLVTAAAQSQTPIALISDDPAGTTSFTNGLRWSDGLAPHGDADYLVANGRMLRTPEGIANYAFGGQSLTISNANVNLKGTGQVFIGDLRLYACRLANGISGIVQLYGTNTVFGTASGYSRFSGSSSRTTRIHGILQGAGELSFDRTENESGAFSAELRGDNSAFAGGMRVVGPDIELRLVHTNGLGGTLESFRADALGLVNSGALYVASSMTIGQANRGVMLVNGGVFRVTGANVLTLAGPVAGTGGAVIKGDGRVDLNFPMTYSGDTTVEGGTLRILAGFSLPEGNRVVMKSGTRVLEGEGFAGNVRMEGGSINPGAGTESGLFTVSNLVMSGGALRYDFGPGGTSDFVRVIGTLSNALATPIPVALVAPVTNECPEVRRLLTAPNLGDFALADFALQRAYAGLPEGDLDLIEEEGVRTLVFRQARPVIRMSGQDGTSSFSVGDRWSDGAAPTSDKDYLMVGTALLRTPGTLTGTETFPGHSLTITESADMRTKGLSAHIPDLRLYGGRITQGTPPTVQYLSGNVSVFATTSTPFNVEVETDSSIPSRGLMIGSVLHGSGDLRFRYTVGSGLASGGYFALTATNTDFTGGITVNGFKGIELRVADEHNLGGNPAAFRPDLLKLMSNGVLYATSSLTIDDPNRGITLDAVGGVLRVETNNTLAVAAPITGVGALTQRGGRLVLSGANSYRGGTLVESNSTLEVRSPWALGSNSVAFATNTTLRIPRDPSALPLGVRLGGATPLTAEGPLRVEPLLGEGPLPKAFDMPLFLLTQAAGFDTSLIALANTPAGYSATVATRNVDDAGTARTQVYVRYRWVGLVMLVL